MNANIIDMNNYAQLFVHHLSDPALDRAFGATFNAPGTGPTLLQRCEVLPDGADFSIGECVAALWDNTERTMAQTESDVGPEGLLVVYHGPDRNGSWEPFTGSRAYLDIWDPFAADDGWPGPAVGGYSCFVSPLMSLRETAYYARTDGSPGEPEVR